MMKNELINNFEEVEFAQRNATEYRRRSLLARPATPSPFAVSKQIKATAGLGKTRAVLEAIARDPNWSIREVHFHTPDHSHAEEISKLACKLGLRVKVIAGRTSGSESSGFCKKFGIADEVAKQGINVYRSCCQNFVDYEERRCPFFDDCPYLKQWADDKPALRILHHSYIFLPTPQRDGVGLPDPALVVVDESILRSSIDKFTFRVDRVGGSYGNALRQHVEKGKDLRIALIDTGISADDARKQAEAIDPTGFPEISPNLNDTEAQQILEDSNQKENKALAAFYRAIAREIDFNRSIYGIEVRRDEDIPSNLGVEKQYRVHVFERKICRVNPNASLLLLDADASLQLNEKIYRRKIQEVEINAKRRAYVIQCHSSKLSNIAMFRRVSDGETEFTRSFDKVESIVKTEAKKTSKLLVVMPMKLEISLSAKGRLKTGEPKYWYGAEVTHFGALRGKDRWKSLDTVIIIGRNEPSPRVIDDYLRGLFSDEPDEMSFVGEKEFPQMHRGYRPSNGTWHGVKTSVHPDPRGQLILEQIRESETVQAVDRIRLVHSDHLKRVIILSSVPINITVDELRTLDDLAGTEGREGAIGRLRKALDKFGILPLGARDLTRCHKEIFPSPSSARDALRNAKKHVSTMNPTAPLSGPVTGVDRDTHRDPIATQRPPTARTTARLTALRPFHTAPPTTPQNQMGVHF